MNINFTAGNYKKKSKWEGKKKKKTNKSVTEIGGHTKGGKLKYYSGRGKTSKGWVANPTPPCSEKTRWATKNKLGKTHHFLSGTR